MAIKFSIITCTWNSEPFLSATIDSVLSQDHPCIEYIFVDGGSTDGTLERIRGLDRPYKLLENIRGGISHAMNEGIRVATGDVIAHLHSDDYFLHEHVLRDVASVFELSGCDWLFGRTKTDVFGDLVEPNWQMPPVNFIRLLRGNFIPHPATFLRKNVFEDIGEFDIGLRYAMDYDFWLRLMSQKQPYYFDKFLTAFRQHEGSLSSANPLATLDEDYQVRRRYISDKFHVRAEHWLRHKIRRMKIIKSVGHDCSET